MKKILLTVCLTAFAAVSLTNVNAQSKGEMAVGGNIAIGMGDGFTNFGIQPKFQYNVIDRLRLEGSFTIFFPKTYDEYGVDIKYNAWDICFAAQYLFPVGSGFTLYPMAGLGVYGHSAKIENQYVGSIKASTTDFCFTIGAGVDYELNSQWSLTLEPKFKIIDGSRFILALGTAYKF